MIWATDHSGVATATRRNLDCKPGAEARS